MGSWNLTQRAEGNCALFRTMFSVLPPQAASICKAVNTNGLTNWKDESGASIKENRELEAGGVTALKPYPDYKASGVDWLGDVPSHWEVRPLGRIGRFSKGSGGTKKDESAHGIPCIRYGDLYTQHQFFITESRTFVTRRLAANYTPIRYGDVLFAGSGETIEEIGKSAVNLIRGPACWRRRRDHLPAFNRSGRQISRLRD